MLSDLRKLGAYRELLGNWALREIRVRYKQSLLGIAWAILQPLAMMLVFTAVFSRFAKIPSDGIAYPVFSYTALLPWTFLATSVSFGVPSIVRNMDLVTKVYFPREILPISTVMAAFIDLLIASVVVLGLLFHYGFSLTRYLLWVPAVLILQILLTLGLVLFASAVNVFFRDIRFAVPLVIQVWMYATPIVYPVSLVPQELRSLYMLNPMAPIIDSYRRVILFGQPPHLGYLGLGAVVSVLAFCGGYRFFKRTELSFADLV